MNFKSLFKKKNKSEEPEFVATPKVRRKATLGDFKIGTTIKALFFFLLIIVPIAVFAYVIYHSTGLDIYQHYVAHTNDAFNGKHVWDIVSAPNANNIFSLFWAGMALLIITTFMICFYGVFAWLVPNKRWQTTYVFTVIIIAAIGVLLTALSQYFYAKFYDFYLYEAQTGVNDQSMKASWAKEISAKLSDDYKSGQKHIFDWMKSAVVWWIMFVQFMFLFGIGVSLQNSLNDKNNLNDYEKYISDAKQDEVGVDFSKVNRFFRGIFKNNDKNTAKFLIVITLVIVIPNFVYSIIGTVDNSNMQSVIAWSYKVPDLVKDIDLSNAAGDPNKQIISELMNQLNANKYGTIFLVLSLQIILEGLTIATLFFFITMLLRGKNVSNRIFIVESAILFVELIALISVSLVSKIYVYRLADFWQTVGVDKNTHINEFTNALKSLLPSDYGNIEKMYSLNNIANNGHIHIEWLDKTASIAEAIIAYAWVFGNFTIVTYNIYRLGYFKKANITTYESGIFNS